MDGAGSDLQVPGEIMSAEPIPASRRIKCHLFKSSASSTIYPQGLTSCSRFSFNCIFLSVLYRALQQYFNNICFRIIFYDPPVLNTSV